MMRISAETPNAYVVNYMYLHIPAKTPTQVATKKETDCMHNFAGLTPPQTYFVNDATQPTIISILAQLILQLYGIYSVSAHKEL